MPQYDGSIRINTEIEYRNAKKELKNLESSMSKTAEKVASLRSKMDTLKDVKTPTDEYKKLQEQVAKADDELERLKKLKREGFLATKIGDDYLKIDDAISKASNNFDSLYKKMTALVAEGKAFTFGTGTEKYAQISAQLEKYNQQMQSDTERQAELQDQIAEREEHLADIKTNSTVIDQNIIDLLERRKQLMQEIADMEEVGVGLGHAEYEDAIVELSEIEEEIKDYKDSLSEVPEKFAFMRSAAQKAFNAIRSGFFVAGRVGKKFFSSITSGSKQSNASMSTNLKTILKYTLGIRSLYVLFNKLRSAAKEGLSNLAQYSTPVNESISMLMSSLTQLKNSLATAFAPIITTVAPILISFISMLSQAATYVGMFIATLTGAKTFTKAIAVQEDYAKSLNGTASAAKKAAGALAKFDDLDVLQKQDTSGGGAGSVSVGDMFEEVEIPNRFEGIVEWFKKMWDESDFKELGGYLADGLKEALDSIPWNNIKESARNIAKSIATFINGAIETEGLGYSIGNTLAQGINTGFEFLNSFVHTFNFSNFGKFIAENLNGFFENIDWSLIKDTFVTGFKGLANSINSFIANFHWDNISDSLSSAVNTLTSTIYEFFSTVEWGNLGKNLGDQLMETIRKIDFEEVGRAIGSVVQGGLDFVIEFVKTLDLKEVAQAVIDTIKGFFDEVDMGDFALVVGGVITAGLILHLGASVFASAATAIGTALASSLTAYALPLILTAVAGWGIVGAIKSIIEGETAIDSIVSGEFKERIIEDYDQIAHASVDSVLSIVESNNELVKSFDNASEKSMEMRGQIENTSASVEDLKNTTKESTDDMSRTWGIAKDSIVGGISAITDGMKVSFSKTYKSILDDTRSFIADLKKMMEGMSTVGGSVVGGMAAAMPRSSYSVSAANALNDIPQLATGTVLRGGNPFMAILNDQPAGQTNIEAPLSTIEQAVENVMNRRGYNNMPSGGLNPTFSFNLNGEEFARLTLGDILNEMSRQGYDVDVLGVT